MTNALVDKTIDLIDEDEHVNVLVYGPSGIGKTVLGGSDDGVLFIAPEDNGTLSAKRFGSKAKKWPVKGWTDIEDACSYWESKVAAGETIPHNWFVIDSATEMQRMCMRHILDEAVRENPARDPYLSIQDWQRYYEMFMRVMRRFNALPVNVLWTALEQDDEDEEGNKLKVPLLQGKGTQFAKTFASHMTSFGYMAVVRQAAGKDDDGQTKFVERRVIVWRATDKITAKDRTRTLEPRTVDLSLKQIRERIENGPCNRRRVNRGRYLKAQPRKETQQKASV